MFQGCLKVKVAVAAKGKTLNSHLDDRFGHCCFFVVVDSESMDFEWIGNPGLEKGDAAGVDASHVLIQKGVDAVVTRNIGHNALVTLRGAGIRIYLGVSGTVRNAIERVNQGELTVAERPTVGFQHGLDRDKALSE